MLFFGKKSPVLHSETMFGKKCPHCNTAGSVEMRVVADYAHIYWIPFFPMGKKGVSFCQHCKQTLDYKQMPPNFQAEFDLMKTEVKTPVWQFAGLGVIASLIAFAVYQSNEAGKNYLLYLNNPQAGDLYGIKTELGSYSLLKVVSVNDDTVWVNSNAMQVSSIVKLHKIDEPQNFYELVEPMLKSKLLEMQQKGDLVNVKR